MTPGPHLPIPAASRQAMTAGLVALLPVFLAACAGHGADRVSPVPDVGDLGRSSCPASVRAFLVDLCREGATMDLVLQDCAAPSHQYQVPTGQAGIPDEWGPAGLTPATATAYIQSYQCASGRFHGKAMAAVDLAVIAGGVSGGPPINDTNVTVWTGDYLFQVVTDSPLLVDYVAWRGFPATLATASFTPGSAYTVQWQGDGWSMTGACGGQRDPATGSVHYYHWRGNVASPQTLFMEEEGSIASLAGGSMVVSGGVMGAHLAPAVAAPTLCGVHHTDVLGIAVREGSG